MSTNSHPRAAVSRYRFELTLAGTCLGLGVAAGALSSYATDATSVERIEIALLTALVCLLLALYFNIKRAITWRIASVHDRIEDLLGGEPPTQYDERKRHFQIEKPRLANHLVHRTLPDLAANIRSAAGTLPHLAIVIDSGTTLEPVFPILKQAGLGGQLGAEAHRTLEVYTNSLSGCMRFCHAREGRLTEQHLHLFGGTHLEKYRAVTGTETLDALRALRRQCDQRGTTLIGVITANWLLVGRDYDRLILCAAEKEHYEFKVLLAALSDHLIVVSPLGKLLRLDDRHALNAKLDLQGQEHLGLYDGFSIDGAPRRSAANTYLLTTYRQHPDSVLYRHSQSLITGPAGGVQGVFTPNPRDDDLRLDHGGSWWEQIAIEVPHIYLRKHAGELLQVSGPRRPPSLVAYLRSWWQARRQPVDSNAPI